jgi:hypothetical protein
MADESLSGKQFDFFDQLVFEDDQKVIRRYFNEQRRKLKRKPDDNTPPAPEQAPNQ